MPKAPKFDQTQASKMVSMYKGKKTLKEIANTMKTTHATVVSYLKKAGVFKPRKISRGKNRSPKQAVTGMTSQAIRAELSAAQQRVNELKKLLKSALRDEQKFLKLRA